MKTLALLSIWLALPLLADDVRAGGFWTDCSSSSHECVDSGLTPAQNEQLALALMQAQAARLNLLEALAGKRAGTEDITAAEQASQAYAKLLQSFVKEHSACDGGQWHFAEKKWLCPPVQTKPGGSESPKQ